MDWHGRVACVSGGVSGIRQGIAEALNDARVSAFGLTKIASDQSRIRRRQLLVGLPGLDPYQCLAALPKEQAPPECLEIDRLHYEAGKAATVGKVIGLGDLT